MLRCKIFHGIQLNVKVASFSPNFNIGEKGSNFHIYLYTVKYFTTKQLGFHKLWKLYSFTIFRCIKWNMEVPFFFPNFRIWGILVALFLIYLTLYSEVGNLLTFFPNFTIWGILVASFLLYFTVYSEIWKLLPFFPDFKI